MRLKRLFFGSQLVFHILMVNMNPEGLYYTTFASPRDKSGLITSYSLKEYVRNCYFRPKFPKVWSPGPRASTSHRKLLTMKIPRFLPKPNELAPLRVGTSNWYKEALQVILMEVWYPLVQLDHSSLQKWKHGPNYLRKEFSNQNESLIIGSF